MIKKIKLLFVINSLAKGGAERVFSNIANNLNFLQYDVTVIVFNRFENEYSLNSNISILNLNVKRSLFGVHKLFKAISSLRPDIVYSTIGQTNIIVGLMIPILKKITPNTLFFMRETSVPSMNNKFSQYPAMLLKCLIKVAYPQFDKIIVQGENMKKDLINNFEIKSESLQIVKNPVLFTEKRLFINKLSSEIKIIITIGNLTKIKGYDRLLEIIYELSLNSKIKFEYWILGEGNERGTIESTILKLGLRDIVKLQGQVSNVSDYLKRADLLIQGSYYEGFPNSIIEANIYGLPVVAFDVLGGTSEIIKEGFNGFLVNDNDKLKFVEKVLLALEYSFDREAIVDNITEKHCVKNIMREYDKLFRN